MTRGSGTGWWSKFQDFKNRDDKIEGDSGRGRENAQRGVDNTEADDSSTKEGSDFKDFLDGLPDPDELDPDDEPCQVRVTISGFKTTEQGTKPICVPDSPSFTEVVVYNSWSEAMSVCDQLNSQSNCGSNAPCFDCMSCIVTATVGGEGCEPSDPSQKGVIGYRSGVGNGPTGGLPPGDDSSFLIQ